MSVVDMLGWLATGLLIVSVAQSNMVKLRVASVTACAVWIVYAVMLGTAPLVATNSIIAVMNIYHIVKHQKGKVDAKSDEVAGVIVKQSDTVNMLNSKKVDENDSTIERMM